jgi:hypothetical protein
VNTIASQWELVERELMPPNAPDIQRRGMLAPFLTDNEIAAPCRPIPARISALSRAFLSA